MARARDPAGRNQEQHTLIRLTYLLRRKSGMTLEEFQNQWRDVHGPLVAGHAHRLGCLRYLQGHTIEDELRETMSGPRGQMETPYDGVIEMWWDSVGSLEGALGTAEGRRAAADLLDAEREFIDLAASPLWLAHEYPQVNPTPENLVARERSSIVKMYSPLRPPPTLGDEDAQRYWHAQHGPLIRRQASGRLLRYVQVHRFAHAIEDRLREARGTEVAPYIGHAEIWRDRLAPRTGTPEGEAAGRRAIADEANFIDWSRSSIWFAKERVFVDRV